MLFRCPKEEFKPQPAPNTDENCAFEDFHPAYFELAAMKKRTVKAKGDIHEHR